MAINSIENAVAYSNELDRLFTQKSATGFFADNALRTKFVGKTRSDQRGVMLNSFTEIMT